MTTRADQRPKTTAEPPIPASYAFVGAAVALVALFAVLAFARDSRFHGDDAGRPARW